MIQQTRARSEPAVADPTMLLLGRPMLKIGDGHWTGDWESPAVQAVVYEERSIYLAHYWVYGGNGRGALVEVVRRKDRIKSAAVACQRLAYVLGLVRDALNSPARQLLEVCP